MGSVVHIPEADLGDAKSLLDMARDGKSVIIDGEGQSFRLTLQHDGPGRTPAEMLVLLGEHGETYLDDEWSADLKAIMRENRAHDRDPWAE